jgi:serine/threonine protein kinase
MLKVGNTIGKCLCFIISIELVCLDELQKQIGFGSGKVFVGSNVRTEEMKALKAIPILGNLSNNLSLSLNIQIGMETCLYLVQYYNIFEEGDFQIIVMDYFENGDLETYINSVKKLIEEVLFIFL